MGPRKERHRGGGTNCGSCLALLCWLWINWPLWLPFSLPPFMSSFFSLVCCSQLLSVSQLLAVSSNECICQIKLIIYKYFYLALRLTKNCQARSRASNCTDYRNCIWSLSCTACKSPSHFSSRAFAGKLWNFSLSTFGRGFHNDASNITGMELTVGCN